MSIGLYWSPTRYLMRSSSAVRRVLRRASNTVGKEPSLVRPHFAGPYCTYIGALYHSTCRMDVYSAR